MPLYIVRVLVYKDATVRDTIAESLFEKTLCEKLAHMTKLLITLLDQPLRRKLRKFS